MTERTRVAIILGGAIILTIIALAYQEARDALAWERWLASWNAPEASERVNHGD